MRKLKNLEEKFFNVLENEFPNDELQMMFDQLAEKHLEISNTSNTRDDLAVNDLQEEKLERALSRLKNNEPIQYILGEAIFFGRTFKVNSNVHVPRPETETMVNWVKEDFPALQQNKNTGIKLLDIGTGCGLLPITLNKELSVNATAVDISEKALEVARENAVMNDAEVQFLKGDVLKWEKLPEAFDIIVSNPPYVLEKSKKDVQRKI